MTCRPWQKLFRAAGAIVGLALSVQAGAVVFYSDFDPVGFAGTAQFTIASSCLVTNGWNATNFSYFDGVITHPSCGTALLVTAESHNAVGPITDSVTITGGSPFDVIGVFVQSGLITGIDTIALGPGFASPVSTFPTGPLWLDFDSGHLPGIGPSPPLAVSLFTGTCSPSCFPDESPVGVARDVTFRVPEPGTFALLFGSLCALGLVRRRREM